MPVHPDLTTYLRDHLAGSSGGVSLAKRMASTTDDARRARELKEIASDIEADQEKLEQMMERLDIHQSQVKKLGAWLGERASRLKLHSRSPGGRIMQLESLTIGVTGKLELWRTLGELSGANPELRDDELEKLCSRAEEQRERLEALHIQVAREFDSAPA
ncbi:hypothetical protein BH20ACT15_BH20ACT15_13130 [soil metagenome]